MEFRCKVLACLRTEFPGLKDYGEESTQEAVERTLHVWVEGRSRPGVRGPLPPRPMYVWQSHPSGSP